MSAFITKFAVRDKASGLFYNPHSGKFSEKPKLWTKRTDSYQYADMIVSALAREHTKPAGRRRKATDWEVVMKIENIEIVTFELTEKKVTQAWQMYGELKHPKTGEEAPAGQFWAMNCVSGNWFLEEIGTPYTLSPASETYHCS